MEQIAAGRRGHRRRHLVPQRHQQPDRVGTGARLHSCINVGRARTQGVESFLAWKALDDADLARRLHLYRCAGCQTTHLALLRRPRHKASLSADWQATGDLSAWMRRLLYVGPQIDGNRDFSIPRLKMAGYTLLDLAADWQLDDKCSLFGRIENAFDTRYQSPDGFLRPGIGAYAGIKASL